MNAVAIKKVAVAVAAAAVAGALAAPAHAASYTERISVSSSEVQGNGNSWGGKVSANGRYVAFSSLAPNLVSNDTNGARDVFVRDRYGWTGSTRRVSVGPGGAQANGDSGGGVDISDDGRWVAFTSDATNLVPDDTNGVRDIFVHDRDTAQTYRVSVKPGGGEVLGESSYPSISADGRYVAFESKADTLVPGDTNSSIDVFVKDVWFGGVTLISVGQGGAPADSSSGGPSISADGRYVAFTSWAKLVPGDGGTKRRIFRRDVLFTTTERISVGLGGAAPNGDSLDASISDDGNRVAFTSHATNLVDQDTNGTRDVFRRDVNAGTTRQVSILDGSWGDPYYPSISGNGTKVLFTTHGTKSVVWVRDLFLAKTSRVSWSYDGGEANGDSLGTALSADGEHAVFSSTASNIKPGDTNERKDVFVRWSS